MYLVGLTGGIASGKSSVAELWQELGAEIIDADVLAREVVAKGSEGLAGVVKLFGERILDSEGNLNRKMLASLVFDDEKKRVQLESLIHPLIQNAAQSRIGSSKSSTVVYVVPLLVETKSRLPFDLVVTVEAPESEQVSRMISSRGMTETEALARIHAQATPAMRANHADRILNSNQALELLRKDAKSLWAEIVRLSAQKENSNGS